MFRQPAEPDDADAMARDIIQAGRVALYGIFFEIGNAPKCSS